MSERFGTEMKYPVENSTDLLDSVNILTFLGAIWRGCGRCSENRRKENREELGVRVTVYYVRVCAMSKDCKKKKTQWEVNKRNNI